MNIEYLISLIPINFIIHFGLFIIFFAALFETIPLLGTILPGMTLVILGGTFASLGYIPLIPTIIFASLGAIIGDIIAYFLGKYLDKKFVNKYKLYLFGTDKIYNSTKRILNSHTGKTIILGRFNSLTRAVIPFLTGIMEIPFKRFMIFNIIGGISWGTSFVLIGYFIGFNLKFVEKYLGIYLFYATIILVILFYIYYIIKKYSNKILEEKYFLEFIILFIISIFTLLFIKIIYISNLFSNFYLIRNSHFSNKLINSPIINLIHFFGTYNFLIFILIIITTYLIYKRRNLKLYLLYLISILGFLNIYLIRFIIGKIDFSSNTLFAISTKFPSISTFIIILIFFLIYQTFRLEILNKIGFDSYFFTSILFILSFLIIKIFLYKEFLVDIFASLIIGILWILIYLYILKIFKLKEIKRF